MTATCNIYELCTFGCQGTAVISAGLGALEVCLSLQLLEYSRLRLDAARSEPHAWY